MIKELSYLALLLSLVIFLSLEKVKLSWEVSILHNNFENLQIEYDNLKDLNLKSPSKIALSIANLAEVTATKVNNGSRNERSNVTN